MTGESWCSQKHPKEQQLYMLELLVDRLTLTPEKIEEIGSSALSVRLEFLDFPTFEISEEEFWSATKHKEKQKSLSTERKKTDGSLDFSAGKSCLFPKRPNELVEAMRSQPMKVAVYKVEEENIWAPQNKRRQTPICKSEVPLSGCLCDPIAMSAEKDSSHLPKPYTLHDTWNLIDEQGTPSGTIILVLRLTCLGKLVVTQFAVQEKSFLFKQQSFDDSPNEFQCSRVPSLDEKEEVAASRADEILESICIPAEGHLTPQVNNSLPQARNVIGLGPICQQLAERDGGGPFQVVPSFKLSTHRVAAAEEKASKINVDKVPAARSGLIRGGPEQGDSSVELFQMPANEFPCGNSRAVCSGGLCAGPRMMAYFEPTAAVVDREPINCSCSRTISSRQNGTLSPQRTHNYHCKPRMRGGGRWDNEELLPLLERADHDPCSKFSTRVPAQSLETLVTGACKSVKTSAAEDSIDKPGCCCYGKLGTGIIGGKSENGYSSKNKPCLGVDCLIRAFEETRDFVNSIGKVPGLAGLGLMDPAESPFFGRDRETTSTAGGGATTCAEKRGAMTPPGTYLVHSRPAIENHQLLPKSRLFPDGGKTIDTILPAPRGAAGNVMSNTIHGVSPVKSKIKKPEEKTQDKHNKELRESSSHPVGGSTMAGETGPCGTIRCKSKKKKKLQEPAGITAGNVPSIAKSQVAPLSLRRIRQHRGNRTNKSYPNVESNNGTCNNGGHRHSYIKVSRRIMRLVNAIRDPRFCHGHKNCLDVRMRVPGNMGWLWNTREIPTKLKPPIGWKPGAISKFVWDRMQQAKSVCPGSTATESRLSLASATGKGRIKGGKALRGIRSFHSASRSPWARSKFHEDDNEIELPPTLHIHRKNKTYYVTMYPVQAENPINGEGEDFQEKQQVKPLQFKVTKNKDEGAGAAASSSSSSASDMELEFSPPAAINRYKIKEPRINRDTQVHQQEIIDTFKTNAAAAAAENNPPNNNKKQPKKKKKK